MTATAPARLASRRGARLALALAVAVLFLAPRLWRIEAVGEGTDEGFSVSATRALAEGRFSYSHLDDFRHDAYAAKFQPVAEAVAVPFLAILGDRPLAFRLPSLLAGAALLVLLLRHVLARHGRAAAAVLLALFLLDYRGVYYAQTHRYVALAQVLAFAAYLLVARALRAGTAGAWCAVAAVGVLLLHTHLMAAVALLPLFAAAVLRRRDARTGSAVLPSVVLGGLLAYAGAMLLWFRAVGLDVYGGPVDAGGGTLLASARTTGRMCLGMGPGIAVLAVAAVPRCLRGPGFPERAAGLAVVLTGALWLAASPFLHMAPRYALCAQPLFLVAAAGAGGRLLARLPARFAARAAFLALIAAPSAGLTAWYLGTGGGGRDAEVPLLDVLRERSAPGDAVLYDVAQEDPYGRRPTDLVVLPRRVTRASSPEEAFGETRTVWILRSSRGTKGALYAPAFEAALERVAEVSPREILQAPYALTLFRWRAGR